LETIFQTHGVKFTGLSFENGALLYFKATEPT